MALGSLLGRWRCAGAVLGDRCHPLRSVPQIPQGDIPRARPRGHRGGGAGLRAGVGGPRAAGVPRTPPHPPRCFEPGFSLSLGQPSSSPAEEPGTPQKSPGSRAGPRVAALGTGRAHSPAQGLSRCPCPVPTAPGSGAAPNPPARRGCVEPLCPDNAEESQRFRARGGPRPLGLGKPRRGERVPPTLGSGSGLDTRGCWGSPPQPHRERPDPVPEQELGVPVREAVGTPPLRSSGCPAQEQLPRSPPGHPTTPSLEELLPGRSRTGLIPADLHSLIVSQGLM